MLFYEPGRLDRSWLPHDPFKALVAPRPIGWLSTIAAGGSVNLAPYSFFNAVAEAPPMLAFSSHGAKHSAPSRGRLGNSGPARRAQRAAEAAMTVASELLVRSEPRGDTLHLDGVPLTAERIRGAMRDAAWGNGAVLPIWPCDEARAGVRSGVTGRELHAQCCERFEAEGYRTQ